MSNKTSKKSGTTVKWPDGHFTIDDVWQKLGGEKVMPNITLRFRVNKAEEAKEIVLIGKIKPSIGRPKKVYAKVNPSKEVLEAAKAAGVIPVDDTKPAAITVAEVKTEKKVKAVVPVAATADAPATPVTDQVPSTVTE
jgi:hypothetical protein